LPDGYYFGVSSGVVGRRYAIDALSDNVAVSNDDRSKGATLARQHIVDRKLDGASHEGIVHVFGECVTSDAMLSSTANFRAISSTWTRSQPLR
jgi:hypothetical protein